MIAIKKLQQEERQAAEQVENVDSDLESNTSLGSIIALFNLTYLIVNSLKRLFFTPILLSTVVVVSFTKFFSVQYNSVCPRYDTLPSIFCKHNVM